MKVVLFLCLFLLACNEDKATYRNDESRVLSGYVKYYKDTRTGLCFAGAGLFSHGALFTAVTCTTEIEKNIVTFASEAK